MSFPAETMMIVDGTDRVPAAVRPVTRSSAVTCFLSFRMPYAAGRSSDGQTASFGQILHRQRLLAGLTQEGLAERSGLSARAIAYLEQGRRLPLPSTFQRLTAALSLGPEMRMLLFRAMRDSQREADAAASR